MKFFFFLICIAISCRAEDPSSSLTHIEQFTPRAENSLPTLRSFSLALEAESPFTSSDVPIDILIPTVEKDLHLLEHVVSYARRHVLHPIRAIYVVAPLTENIINVCRQLGLHLIDESSVLPIQRHQISYFPKGIDRRGWIFQQLLKLSADEICSSDHILVIDSDTLLIRPQTFIKGPYTILNCADEYHLPYFTCYERLIQEKPTSPFSFVCHHMLFERSKLKHLKAHIEGLHQSPWYQAIIDKAEHGEVSGFSEYETYGNFFISHYPDEFLLLYFFNANMCRSRAGDFLNGNVHWDVYGTTPLDEKIKSVSFHHFHW